MLQSSGQSQQWPTSGRRGDITPAAWGVPNALERRTKLATAHNRVEWLQNPCCMGDPQHFKAGDKNSNGPQVGGLAT